MRKSSFLLFPLLLLFFSTCTTSRFVKPLEKGERAVSANLGGPLIGFAGTTIPIPFTSVTYGRGLSENITGFSGIHITALAFGVVQTDVGLVWEVLPHKVKLAPGISVSPVANLMFDLREWRFRFYPLLDINAYWTYSPNEHFFYIGNNNWFEFRRRRAHGELQPHHFIPNFHVGNTFRTAKMNYSVEMKYLAPFISNRDIVVDYRSLGDMGAIGIYLSVTRRF